MRKIKKALLWFFLLDKRFLRKPLLLLLLCMIPLTALLASRLPQDHGTLLRIGVSSKSPDDRLAREVMKDLTHRRSRGAVRYIAYKTSDQMAQAVKKGDIRLGFLFPEDLSKLAEAYAEVPEGGSGGAMSLISQALGVSGNDDIDLKEVQKNQILVICSSNDIVTKLEKEQFFGNIYHILSNAVLKAWMNVHASGFPVSESERDAYLDRHLSGNVITDSFFQLSYLSGDTVKTEDMDQYYLAPMKGLLAITLILICFAACLFLIQDNQKGLFVWVAPEKRALFHYLYLLIPVLDGGLFALLALRISGLLRGPSDIPAFLLYLFCVTGFSNLVRVLTRKIPLFSSTIPIVIMGCLFLTPVFLDMKILPKLQMLLPPYLYLKSGFGQASLFSLFAYALVSSLASLAIDFMESRI